MSTIILIEPGAGGSNQGTQQWQRELDDFEQYLSEHGHDLDVVGAAGLTDDQISAGAQEFFDVHLDGETHVNRTPMGDIIVSKEYKYAEETGL